MSGSRRTVSLPIDPLEPTVFTKRILAFFDQRKRELPWRENRDAYPIWISEIMLQQTRVDTVVPFFRKWMATFPTIKRLAQAPLDEVLGAWSGLGYYSRARNIHRCAEIVCRDHNGRLPAQAEVLGRLPGIGRYTAGAIRSQAFDQPAAVVDGNVARVLARLYALDVNVKTGAGKKMLWAIAEHLVPNHSPGDYNQGLMELGQSVCFPRSPDCSQCPMTDRCRAFLQRRTGELPILPKRLAQKDKPLLRSVAVLVVRKSKLLLGHRPETGLYAGLWELPQALSRARLLDGLRSLRIHSRKPVMIRKQELSHRRLQIEVWRGELGRKPPRAFNYTKLAWYSPNSLTELGVSAATSAIVDTLVINDINQN